MTRCLIRLAFALALLAVPSAAFAQWETPNRSFHKTTVFPLEGRHLTVPCTACHVKGEIKGTPTLCADCHWSRRQDDPYRTRLGAACEQCHKPSSWKAVKWDHGAMTGMPLTGAHRSLTCDQCHKGAVFTSASLMCNTCHMTDYNNARQPDHRAAGFPTTCDTCHKASDVSFSQGRFDHNSVYPLRGAHASVDCSSCHAGGRYHGTPTDCVGCHRTDYDRTTLPNHAASGISTQCDGCHRNTDLNWGGSNFNHSQFYPLVGVHATQACAACHTNGRYSGTPTDCYTCHRTNYERTSTPAHGPAGFSTQCDTCHKASDPGWMTATFNHNQFYALVGVHTTQACTACHINGVYRGTPTDCFSCHKTNYNQTSTPNHMAAAYPTTCDSCHKATDATWLLAKFNHTGFPITSGRHSGNPCTACHTNPSTYTVFTCTTSCHPRSQTDSHHVGRSGYSYDSIRCYACHPTGRAG